MSGSGGDSSVSGGPGSGGLTHDDDTNVSPNFVAVGLRHESCGCFHRKFPTAMNSSGAALQGSGVRGLVGARVHIVLGRFSAVQSEDMTE